MSFWIKYLNIEKSRCNFYLEEKDKTCYCGLKYENHNEEAKIKSIRTTVWDPELDTVNDGLTDAYGELVFKNNIHQTAKYLRISHKTELKKINQLFGKKFWNLKPPNLIVSITGGAKPANLSDNFIDVICKGVVNVASTTDGWITTGGTYAGIMKYVGRAVKEEAIKKDKLVLLGIANWTSVKRRKDLIRREGDDDDDEPITYHIDEHEIKDNSIKEQYLDPNHSHFLLVDNAQLNKFGGEIPFRAKFEAFMSTGSKSAKSQIDMNISSSDADFSKPIPVVLVVIEGGPNTVKCVLESLKSNIPCVIIDKTGRFSDIFSYIYRKICEPNDSFQSTLTSKEVNIVQQQNEKSQFKFDEPLRSEVTEMIVENFKGKNDQEILKNIEEIFDPKYKRLISSFELNINKKPSDLDEAILRAFIKSNETTHMAELCLIWNRVDVARKLIFGQDYDHDIEIYNMLMFGAILENRVEFVRMLLENNLNLSKFLTPQTLLKLYNQIPEKNMFYSLIKKKLNLKPTRMNFKNIGRIINELCENIFEHKFVSRNFSENDDVDKSLTMIDPEHDLFILNVLMGQIDIAIMIWQRGKNHIASALLAVKIVKSMVSILDENHSKFEKIACYFENLACEALNLSNLMNESNTQLLLVRRINQFSGINCLQIAVSAECLKFISQPACQNLLTQIWYEKISHFTPKWRIYLGIILPFLVPFLIYFRKNSNAQLQSNEAVKVDEKKTLEMKKERLKKRKMSVSATMQIKRTIDRINIKKRQSEFKRSKLFELSILHDTSKSNYFQKLKYFVEAPFVKFFHSMAFYLTYLILFSYVLLCDFYPINAFKRNYNTSISIFEIVLIIWTISYGLEEFRQIYAKHLRNVPFKLSFNSFRNNFLYTIELLGLCFFLIAIILRFIPSYRCYLAARIILSIDVIFWYIRSLYAYLFIKTLGPKMVMIKKMMVQLCRYFLIMFVFMFALGVCFNALMYHNSELDIDLLRNVAFKPFFITAGDIFYRDKIYFADAHCVPGENNNYDCPNYIGARVALTILVFYILLNILLVTLLISIFYKTHDEIQEEADKIWKFQRFSLVYEYFHKPLLPAPFVLLFYAKVFLKIVIHFFIKRLCSKETILKNDTLFYLYNRTKLSINGFYYEFKDRLFKQRIIKWESYVVDELLILNQKKSREYDDHKLNRTIQTINLLESKISTITLLQKDSKYILHEAELKLIKSLEGLQKKLILKTKEPMAKPSDDSIKSTKTISVNDLIFEKNEHEHDDQTEEPAEDAHFDIVEHLKLDKSDEPPLKYTAEYILLSLHSDIDLLAYPVDQRPDLDYNKYDEKYEVDRTSLVVYKVQNGIPINPMRNTGIIGRGKLFYWGPNYAIQAIFTRWKNDDAKNSKKKILQVAMEFADETHELALPQILIKNRKITDSEVINNLCEAVFDQQLLANNPDDDVEIKSLIYAGTLIDRYIPQSTLNTNNAWIECFVVNYHADEQNELFHRIPLKIKAGTDVTWNELNKKQLKSKTNKATLKYLKKVASLRNSDY